MLFPGLIADLEDQPTFFTALSENPDLQPIGAWNKNQTFMHILHLASEEGEHSMDYDMDFFDVLPLLETSPAYKHTGSILSTAGTGCGWPGTAPPPRRTSGDDDDDQDDTETYPPISGSTQTTTPTTQQPERSEREITEQ